MAGRWAAITPGGPRADNVVVAVDLGVDRLAAAVVGLGGEVLDRRPVDTSAASTTSRTWWSRSPRWSRTCRLCQSARCLGMGVAVPGAVRTSDGMVQFAPNLGWVREPFTELLRTASDRPVSTGNDANLGVLAEHIRGAAVGYSNVAYLSGRVGIGGGFLVDGAPLERRQWVRRRDRSRAGRLEGPVCRCGAVGCWEIKVGENVCSSSPAGCRRRPEAVAEVIAAAAARRTSGRRRARRGGRVDPASGSGRSSTSSTPRSSCSVAAWLRSGRWRRRVIESSTAVP